MTGSAEAWAARAAHLGRSRRLRVSAIAVLAAFVIFSLAGFLGFPSLLDHIAQASVAATLKRRVTVGTIRFNPYTLRLSVDAFGSANEMVSEILPGSSAEGVLEFALAGCADHPGAHHRGSHPKRRALPVAQIQFLRYQDSPIRFRPTVSNLRLDGGHLQFEDQPFNAHHTVDQIQVGIPFIGDLPSETAILERRSLRMVVDGSPFPSNTIFFVGWNWPLASRST